MTSHSEKKVAGARIELLDFVRALAIIQVFFYHYFLEWFGGNFLIVPEGFVKNFERLQVFHDGGFLGLVKNIFAFFFVYGFASVNLFLVLSGFVLTYSLLKKSKQKGAKSWFSFLWKRGKRILIPLYTATVIGIGILFLRNILFPAFGGPPVYFWFDFVKLFFIPFLVFDYRLLQLFNGDYWFIPLILQFYLLFPLLYRVLKKMHAWKFLVMVFVLTIVYRLLATFGYQFLLGYGINIPLLDAAPMGVIYPSQSGYYGFGFFLPRLFEFGLGMGLAALYFQSSDLVRKMLSGPFFLGGLLATFAGFASSYFRFGWIFSDPLMAFGLFVVFLKIGQGLAQSKILQKLMQLISDSTYEIYLLHHYWLNYLLLPFLVTAGLKNEVGFWLFLPIFFVIVVSTGWVNLQLNNLLAKIIGRRL